MSIEWRILKDRPSPIKRCPYCYSTPFIPRNRGHSQSWLRRILGLPYCKVICPWCGNKTGWELTRREKREHGSV